MVIKMQEVLYDEKQLRKRLKYWQKKLRLQDWMIQIQLTRTRNMTDGCEAEINYLEQNKQAKIYISDPVDRPEGVWFPQDMDWLIVHELLHLHMFPFKNEEHPHNYNYIEQAIESMTHGYIALERK